MGLSREAYRALEDIVGPENITEEMGTLDAYTFMRSNELRPGHSKFTKNRPEAVLLPGSTGEVQAIVRTCNRYKIKCKAFSTGWVHAANALTKNVVMLDLRRMDKILEIDSKNMFAVIEPYVTCAQLQAEVMKVGLNCHIHGSGASCSSLAAATSFEGPGPDSIYMGNAPENLLAMEWVLPTGDILKTGSLVSGAGWFYSEGPGPSLRGVVRGASGAHGSMGVFTKCALRLSNWPGPPVKHVEGVIPSYSLQLRDNFRCYTLAFPTPEALTNTVYKIYDAEIGYIANRQFNLWGEDLWPAVVIRYSESTKEMDDLDEMLRKPEIQNLVEETRRSFQFILAGNSQRDVEYQEKALDEILAETGGRKIGSFPESAQRWMLSGLISQGYLNSFGILAGGWKGSFAQIGPPDFQIKIYKASVELKRKHIEEGTIVNDGGDAMFGPLSLCGGGGECGDEQFMHYDPRDPASVEGGGQYLVDAGRVAARLGWGGGTDALVTEPSKEEAKGRLLRSPQPIAYLWQWKIKQALDPNDTGDVGYPYLTDEESGATT